MLPETLIEREAASGVRDPEVVFAPGAPGGALTVNPSFAPLFARLGLTTASAFLELPGEVVSGHPDRHVMRVELPGAPRAFYLKRQHVVGWRERLRNRRAGFGWVSRCEREGILLQQLEAMKLPAPRWAAFGAVGRRAFLLVEEVPGAVDLRRLLSDNALSLSERRELAAKVGRAVAAIHAAGFTTPDLTAKHVLVNPETLAVTLIDWQSATRRAVVSDADRIDALGALHASLAESLATPSERLRALAAYTREPQPNEPRPQGSGVTFPLPCGRGSLAHLVVRAAVRHAKRRSVREQLAPTDPGAQRLVWLAGEAVCAIPEAAAVWPRPVVAPPFYGGPAGTFALRCTGRSATLVRGRSVAPVGRARAWLRAMPWRSPGVTIGRVLFHLARHGVPAPRLLAFGQRLTSATAAEWFALYESPPGIPLRAWARSARADERRASLPVLAECLRKLHDAGCVLNDAKVAFAVHCGAVSVADPRAVRIVRRVSDTARRRDFLHLTRLLGVE